MDGAAGLLAEEVTLYFICGVDDHCLDDPTSSLPPQKFRLTIHPIPEDSCTVRAPAASHSGARAAAPAWYLQGAHLWE